MRNSNLHKILLQNILQYGNVGIHVIDSERKTTIYNKIMEDVEGLKIEQIIDKDILEIFPSLSEETSTLIKVMNSGESILNSTQTYLNYNGRSITTTSSTLPLIWEGKIVGAVEIVNNLTNIKNLSDQLMNLQKELSSSKVNMSNKKNVIKRYNFNHIIGECETIKIVKQIAIRSSSTSSSVLIYGETGTGKEMFAQSIHNKSIRNNKPFIAQNCAAIPESLLEGILFGTDKGGFTGALEREGIFEQASGGTLLLDEINSMSITLQAKLLRVLQEGYVRRIGGIRDIPIDVRIIATTNEQPLESIRAGILRKDLFYRLGVINISIPPLRERNKDLVLLSNHFIHKYNTILKKNVRAIDIDVLNRFQDYTWPGNIRELENFIEGAMNMVSDHDDILTESDFITSSFIPSKPIEVDSFLYTNMDISLPELLADMEKSIIFKTVKRNNNNISRAANELGIKRQTLQHKLKKYN